MPVDVSPHLCLLIGQVVARAAVQREGVALPLAVLRHVTLEKTSSVRLESAYVTPGRGVHGDNKQTFLNTGEEILTPILNMQINANIRS